MNIALVLAFVVAGVARGAGADLVRLPSSASADTQATRIDTQIVVDHGESLLAIAARLLDASDRYTALELADSIRRSNDLGSDVLRAGQVLRVPLRDDALGPRRPRGIIVDPRPARGIYVTATVAGSWRATALADSLVAAGGNTFVFDIKDRDGDLSYLSQAPLARQTQVDSLAPIRRPAALVEQLHRRDLHVVARLTCFYDERLAGARPDLAPRRPDGSTWDVGWLDPSRAEVQDYLLAVVDEIVAFGVDEVQLDYVRFPTEAGSDSAVYAMPDTVARHQVITGFVRRVRDRLAGTGVLLAADVFGVAAWGRKADIDRLGQHLPDLVPLLDVACPMLYPSHFYGSFLGMTQPVNYPYYLVYEGVRRLTDLAAAHGVAVRPWLQSFPYRVTTFDVGYVTEQLVAADDAGGDGWMLWHPASRYDIGLEAIRRVVAKDRDDERPEAQESPLLGAQTGDANDM